MKIRSSKFRAGPVRRWVARKRAAMTWARMIVSSPSWKRPEPPPTVAQRWAKWWRTFVYVLAAAPRRSQVRTKS